VETFQSAIPGIQPGAREGDVLVYYSPMANTESQKRIPADEKESVMEKFRQGAAKVLVSTMVMHHVPYVQSNGAARRGGPKK
jgi:hypothetical protein